jgi:hypothetical protein
VTAFPFFRVAQKQGRSIDGRPIQTERVMDIKVVRVPKAILDNIPELERAFYVHIGHLRNEIMVIQKLAWWNNNNRSGSDVLAAVNVSQGLILIRLLAGKVWEGWDLVGRAYFSTKVSHSIEAKLSIKTREALAELKAYFGKRNIIYMIRNQFAFHYSLPFLRDQLAKIEETDKLAIYLTRKNVNVFYEISEAIANSAMLDAVEKGNYDGAMRKLLNEVLDVAKKFISFSDGCLEYMVETFFSTAQQNRTGRKSN